MLRIFFTPEDLRRVRVAAGPDPLWEILLSLHLLGKRDGSVVFGQWRSSTRERFPADARMLRVLAPPWGYSPDFLTPAVSGSGLDAGIELVLSTPRRLLRHDLALLAGGRQPGPALRALAAGEPDALHGLGTALRRYHDVAIAPHWDQIRARVEADRTTRGQALLDGGGDRLLRGLHPAIHWEPPVLRVEYGFGERTLHLGGRGLVLLPSFFCIHDPITLRDPDFPPVLVYPIDHDPGWFVDATRPPRRRPLATLLGRTRAAVLETVAGGGCTTGELARRLHISASSASEHATVLRDAGLLATHRYRNTSCHQLTRLGTDLLQAGPPSSARPGLPTRSSRLPGHP